MSLKSAGPKMLEALIAFSANVTEEEELDHMATGCSDCILCMAREAITEAERGDVMTGPDGSAFYYEQGKAADDDDAKDFLEGFIDGSTRNVGDVLDILSDLCNDKAEHLAGNWQDASAAKRWTAAGNALIRARKADAIRGIE
jgi:hypothetical protein